MLKFYVVSAGRDMVNALTVLSRGGADSKLQKNKITKCEVPSENMGCTK